MEIRRRLVAPCERERLFPWVDDLGRYPSWMDLVHEVRSVDSQPGEDAAWEVELRAQVGPLARSKRLRMVRTRRDVPSLAEFERAEIDGRRHAPWMLRADLAPTGAGTELTMTLRYGGRLWTGGALERILDDKVRTGSERLLALVTEG